MDSMILYELDDILNGDHFLYEGLDIEFANYYLACPTIKHYEAVKALINRSISSVRSEFVLEFLDEIISTDEDKLDELIFHIKNRSIKKNMTFSEACREFNEQAMEILKNNNGNITPDTIVTVTDYESEFPVFPKPNFRKRLYRQYDDKYKIF